MTQPTKPSAGALRAADRIRDLLEDCGSLKIANSTIGATPFQEGVAEIIDRQTGVAELLEAAKAAIDFLWKERGQIVGIADVKLSEALRQAITKCERGE